LGEQSIMGSLSFSIARGLRLALAMLTGLTLACGALAQVPTQINYQGRLTDAGGVTVNPVSTTRLYGNSPPHSGECTRH
jgi:hypothetical protein